MEEAVYCIVAVFVVSTIAAFLVTKFPTWTYSIGFCAGWGLSVFVNRKKIFKIEEDK